MLKENYVAKQQRIGERLTRAALSDRADKVVSCARREAGVAALLGAPPSLTNVFRPLGPAPVPIGQRLRPSGSPSS